MEWFGRRGRLLLIGLPFAWLMLFFVAPLAIILKISFSRSMVGIPPYTPLFVLTESGNWAWRGSLGNFALLLADDLYWRAYLQSLGNAALATALCLLFGYPMAHAIAQARENRRKLLLFLVILPFWTSFLIRIYAWILILKPNGLLNEFLIAAGVIATPLPLLNNAFSVELGLVYSYLPFMVLPLYGAIAKLDPNLPAAAADLGARPWRIFWRITLPLTSPGIVAGTLLVFIPTVGEFVIPDLLGGPDTLMIGRVLWEEFFSNHDWPVAATVATALIACLVLPLLLAQRLLDAGDAG